MKHSYVASYQYTRIRQIEESDLEKLRIWRNNEALSRYLRHIGEISPEMQREWYRNYLLDDNIISFAIEETQTLKRLVGSASIYDFNGVESNCGKVMIGDPDAKGKGLGLRGETLVLHVGFQKRGIQYYIREVHQENASSQVMTARLGFLKVGCRPASIGGMEDQFRMTKERFYQVHPEMRDVEVLEL